MCVFCITVEPLLSGHLREPGIMHGVGLLPENQNTVHYVTAKICQGDILKTCV